VRIGVDPDGSASSTATFESISRDVAGANGAAASSLEALAARLSSSAGQVGGAAIPAGKLAGTVAVGADMGVGRVASGAFHDGEKLLSWLNPL
jgi:hypothetical protein